MKKVFMASAIVAMMMAAVSCGCNNTEQQAVEDLLQELNEAVDSAAAACCDSTLLNVEEGVEEVAE